MPIARQCLGQPSAYETGAAGHEPALAAGQVQAQRLRLETVHPSRRGEVSDCHCQQPGAGRGCQPRPDAANDELEGSRRAQPLPDDGRQQRQQHTEVDRQQAVKNPFRCRQPSTGVLDEPVGEGDGGLGEKQSRQYQGGPTERQDPGEHQEDHRVGEVARAVQAEFRSGTRAPGQTRYQFVVDNDVGETEHDLYGRDQPDFHGDHGESSNTASWRSTTPKRG